MTTPRQEMTVKDVIPERLVPVTIRQEGMIVGSDGHLYPPQREPEGRARVVALLVEEYLSRGDSLRRIANRLCEGCSTGWSLYKVGAFWFHDPPEGIDPDFLCGASAVWNDSSVRGNDPGELVDKILAAINLNGNRVCLCPHVEGSSDPAHCHGWLTCETCGGQCVSERWVLHEVNGLVTIETWMQQHHMSKVVVRGLNFVLERLHLGIELIARGVRPGPHQKQAMKDLVKRELGNLSHIWFQSSMGDYLYSVPERSGLPADAMPRLYEQTAEVGSAKLKALKQQMPVEEFMARFSYTDPLTPAQALARPMPKAEKDEYIVAAKEQYALEAGGIACWCGHEAHLGSCLLCGCNAVFSSHVDRREPVEVR